MLASARSSPPPYVSSPRAFFPPGFLRGETPPSDPPPSPLSSLPKPIPNVAPTPPLPAPKGSPPMPRNKPAKPPSSGDPNPPPPAAKSRRRRSPRRRRRRRRRRPPPAALHHLLECMAAPFSLNGPAPQSAHVIVLGSRAGSSCRFAVVTPLGPAPALPAGSDTSPRAASVEVRGGSHLVRDRPGRDALVPARVALGERAHQREMCMPHALGVGTGRRGKSSQYSTFSPCSRSSCAARSASLSPRRGTPGRRARAPP